MLPSIGPYFWIPPIILMVLMIIFIAYVNFSHRNLNPKPKLNIHITVEGEAAKIESISYWGTTDIIIKASLPSRKPREIPKLARLLKAIGNKV